MDTRKPESRFRRLSAAGIFFQGTALHQATDQLDHGAIGGRRALRVARAACAELVPSPPSGPGPTHSGWGTPRRPL